MVLVLLVLVIVFNLITAYKFEAIAQMKGHSEHSNYSEYFWWCFLFGPAGWAMVIALPNRKAEFAELSAALKATLKDGASTVSSPETDNDLPDL